MLSVGNLTKFYGKFPALKDVSFQIQEGSTTLLLGPNGAGKTTLIRCVLGLLNFDGEIRVGELDVKREGKQVRAKIGYVPQNSSYYDHLRLYDQASLVAKMKRCDKRMVEEKLTEVDLWSVRNTRVGSLSSGMRQRFGIAMALLADPPLMIFDEPTSNIDMRGQLEFQSLLEELTKRGKTLFIATHISGLNQYANAAIILDSGKIIARGAPNDLIRAINAMDTIYVKLRDSDMPRATELARVNGQNQILKRGEWLLIPVRASEKQAMVQSLLSSFEVYDILIEPATIESQYLKLLNVGS